MSAWIDVKNRLPDLDVRVIVARKGNTKSSKNHVGEDYRGKRFGGKWGKTSGYFEVTHWMQMPKGPL